MAIELKTPLGSAAARALRAGDMCLLTGELYTARGFSASAASAEHHAASRRDATADLSEDGQLCLRILEFKFKIYHRKLFSY